MRNHRPLACGGMLLAFAAALAPAIASAKNDLFAFADTNPRKPAPPGPGVTKDIGVNLDGNAENGTIAMWVDAARQFNHWGPPAKPYEKAPNLKLSDDGYPLEPAGTVQALRGYPDGVYTLTYEGTAAVQFFGIAALEGLPKRNGKRITASVRVHHNGSQGMAMVFTSVDPKDPPHNLHLICPGYPADTKQVFRNEFLHKVSAFSTLRFMDLMHTNGSPVKTWADRTRPETFVQTGPAGVAYELLIDLANATNKDVWICVPALADDDFIQHFAKLFHERLHKDATIYLEYSNETWNFGMQQFHQIFQGPANESSLPGLADREPGKPGGYVRTAQFCGARLKQAADIFRKEFGADAARIRPVLGGQAANPWWTQTGLQYVQSQWGDPKQYFYAISLAPYVTLNGAVDKEGLTAEGLFQDTHNFLDTTLTTWVRNHKKLADQYGLAMVAYEGGQHILPWNGKVNHEVNFELKAAAQKDPRMNQLLRDLVAMWRREGGGVFCHFSFCGPPSRFGFWGLLDSEDQRGSAKWDAMMSCIFPAGDATCDGKVDWSDFQALKKNFGHKDACWEDGDFNGDGVVDAADLELMKKNLKGLTPQQQKEVDTLGSSAQTAAGH